MIEILHRDTKAVILRSETAGTVREALLEMIQAEPHQKWLRDEGGARANLAGANLARAYLARANLAGAYLEPIKEDIYQVLRDAPNEVPGLLLALREGRVDGSQYSGACACLVGTIANVRGVNVDSEALGVRKDSSSPAERFFLAIRRGDKPENHPVSKLVTGWIEEWLLSNPPRAAKEG